jgi:hypothetical protein
MPRKWEEEYMDNSGRTEERYQSEVAGVEDVLVSYHGLKAWVSAHHFEVMAPKKVLLEVLNEMLVDGWSDQLMGRMVEMDDRMDAKGYLRLTTHAQTMRLLGNALDEEVAAIAAADGINARAAANVNPRSGLLARLAAQRRVRNGIQGLINWLYGLLHQNGRE